MTAKSSSSSQAASEGGKAPSQDRQERLSQALRDNLRKRKAQARARSAPRKDEAKS
ncbi:MAG: hypothetical protein WD489_03650 [Rhodovibrionaceae bacterium]